MTLQAMTATRWRHRGLRLTTAGILLVIQSGCAATVRTVSVTITLPDPKASPPVSLAIQPDGSERITWKTGKRAEFAVACDQGYLITAVAPGYAPQQYRGRKSPSIPSEIGTAVVIGALSAAYGAIMGLIVDQFVGHKGIGMTTGLILAVPVPLALITMALFPSEKVSMTLDAAVASTENQATKTTGTSSH